MSITKFFIAGLLSSLVLFSTVSRVYAEEADSGNAIYANGGVGQEESDDMRAKAGDFNLRLYMSEGKSGQSITGVKVIITDKKGNTVLDMLSAGPMLFARVRKGNYKITAVFGGTTITRKVLVTNHRGVNVYLNWRTNVMNLDNDIEDGPS